MEVITSQRFEANADLTAIFFYLHDNFTSVTVLFEQTKSWEIMRFFHNQFFDEDMNFSG